MSNPTLNPANSIDAGPARDLGPGQRRRLDVDGQEVLLIHLDGRIRAVGNVCRCIGFVVGHHRPSDDSDPATHGGKLARLEDAPITGGAIACPRHGSTYDLDSGRPLSGGAEIALDRYRVEVQDERLRVARRTEEQMRMDPPEAAS